MPILFGRIKNKSVFETKSCHKYFLQGGTTLTIIFVGLELEK